MAPPNRVKVQGTPEQLTIAFDLAGRKKITLAAVGCEYGDFGERIINTLTGDLEVYEGDQLLAVAKGTAALERRTPK